MSGGLPIYSRIIGSGGRDRDAQQTTGDGDGLGARPHNHPAYVAPTANMAHTHPRDKFEMMDAPGDVRHDRGWLKWAAGILAALTILGLGLGLGLGLPCSINPNSPLGCPSNPSEPEPTSTSAPLPPPTGVPTLAVRTPWQIMLSETLTVENQSDTTSTSTAEDVALVTPNQVSEPNVTLYDIDMFLHQNLTVVRDLRAKNMTVICYFSSGSYEPDRPDSWKFKSDDKGKELDGWPGEYWLDLNSDNVREIMTARIEIAAKMNCSGIDPDNVDGYDNDNGLGLTEDDSIDFMRFLAQEAGSRGMMTGLKNAGAIIDDVIDYVQFAVNEQCVQYGECDTFSAFPNASKPIFHIEYPAGDDNTDLKTFDTNTISKYCDIGLSSDESSGFNTALKYMNLSGFIQYCDGQTYITDGF